MRFICGWVGCICGWGSGLYCKLFIVWVVISGVVGVLGAALYCEPLCESCVYVCAWLYVCVWIVCVLVYVPMWGGMGCP